MTKLNKSKSKEEEILASVKSAIKEYDEPLCPYCLEPLVIVQDLNKYIYWTWDGNGRRYAQGEDSVSDYELDPPYCNSCLTKDDSFLSVVSALEE